MPPGVPPPDRASAAFESARLKDRSFLGSRHRAAGRRGSRRSRHREIEPGQLLECCRRWSWKLRSHWFVAVASGIPATLPRSCTCRCWPKAATDLLLRQVRVINGSQPLPIVSPPAFFVKVSERGLPSIASRLCSVWSLAVSLSACHLPGSVFPLRERVVPAVGAGAADASIDCSESNSPAVAVRPRNRSWQAPLL